jgi:hypothetical protein
MKLLSRDLEKPWEITKLICGNILRAGLAWRWVGNGLKNGGFAM